MTDLVNIMVQQNKNVKEEVTDFDSLAELITITINPNSWQSGGDGEGTIMEFGTMHIKVLLISQTYENQRRIESLLSKLHKHQESIKKKKE